MTTRTRTVTQPSSNNISAPGMFQWSMNARAGDLNAGAPDVAHKLYFLAAAFPEAPAGVLMAVADENPTLKVAAGVDGAGTPVVVLSWETAE